MRQRTEPFGRLASRLLRVRARTAVAASALVVFLVVAPSAGTGTLDETPPVVSYTIDAISGTNGWYRGSTHGSFVVVRWTVVDPESAFTTSGCEPAVRIDSPTTGTTRTCTATSDGGTTAVTTKTIKVDAEPPTGVTAAADRGPDYNGWYNHPVGVGWHGSDATSGIAGCTSVAFPSAGLNPAGIGGGCTDNAGNSASSTFALQYDATPPTIAGLSVRSTDGMNLVRWKSSSPSDVAVVKRIARGGRTESTLFNGAAAGFADKKIRDATEYRYSVQTFDQAGNASSVASILALPKALTLTKSAYVPRTAGAPVLHWRRARGASYYHVQLFRYGRRIFASWPLKTELRLRQHWRWKGRGYRLSPGTYSWYVWAGLGNRAAARYKLLGSARFTVPNDHR